ncbi:methionine ABC transporter ATP-binding protein MetN [Pedobacter sp. AW1-32]|uniref:methionine ABC transporter ATP-binding protein MetN n=1 Tax=Pedobacter sp. AW1-32 TaxID=3383026 RepID=UPI003FEFDBD2
MIRLQNITKTFGEGSKQVTALSDISLHVKQGQITGVIGASGAGKSTLIRCANLLEIPTSGEVIIDGQNLLKLTRTELAIARRQIGMIFQHFNLLSSRTVSDNIAFPLELAGTPKSKIKERVSELLQFVDLEAKQNDYPASLSGGQKQRVAIARTLAVRPKVLLCDEATSALDPETTTSILNLLKAVNERFGITILLITHEMHVVKSICDEVAIISNGKLIEQGSVADIFSHPKTALAQKFIASSIQVSLPEEYRIKLKSEGENPLLQLNFNGDSAGAAALSEVTRLYGITNHILSAQLENAGSVQYGTILLRAEGSAQAHEQALTYYKNHHIKTEVLGYV